MNSKNEDDKCFQYAATVALNYKEIENHPERCSNIKPFIDKYNLKETNYPPKLDDWKNIDEINPAIALNTLYTK